MLWWEGLEVCFGRAGHLLEEMFSVRCKFRNLRIEIQVEMMELSLFYFIFSLSHGYEFSEVKPVWERKV